ncbi:MAG: hypothetical protein KJ638_01070 [Chloroflexi bacterium]|nr:hypothetical protein [Chloroflexota bacterium]
MLRENRGNKSREPAEAGWIPVGTSTSSVQAPADFVHFVAAISIARQRRLFLCGGAGQADSGRQKYTSKARNVEAVLPEKLTIRAGKIDQGGE